MLPPKTTFEFAFQLPPLFTRKVDYKAIVVPKFKIKQQHIYINILININLLIM